MRRTCVPLLLTLTVFFVSWTDVGGAADDGPLPHVLVLLIDDLGRSDIGVEGSDFHETPHLDALARSGVRFTNFYSAHPVCSPTRAALMTGKVPQRLGITDWIHPGSGIALGTEETTLGEAFHAEGYQTAYLGKWHLGEADRDQPIHHGFEWTRGVNRAGQPSRYHFPFLKSADLHSIWDVPDFTEAREGDYLTDVLTDAAIDFLKQRDTTRPFFICIGHYAVHTPIQPPEGLKQKYCDKRVRRYGSSQSVPLSAPFGSVSRGRQDFADYAAMVENLDSNVERLLTALDELDLRDQTIVVLTSDNGGLCTLAGNEPGPTSNLPWRGGKGWTYEGGIRIPTWITWPNGLPARTIDVPAFTADLFPTLLELCHLPLLPAQHIDGHSLVRALRGDPDITLGERRLAWYYPHDHGSGHQASAAIRHGAWKLVHYLTSETSELYDLAIDPGETRNLANEHPDIVRRLRSELLRWINDTTAAS